jgi:hypothetical protein
MIELTAEGGGKSVKELLRFTRGTRQRLVNLGPSLELEHRGALHDVMSVSPRVTKRDIDCRRREIAARGGR